MIIEALLAVIKFLILGLINILPSIPKFDLKNLDGVFQALSMIDIIVDIRVFVSCLVLLIVAMNLELIWVMIMWVIRKIPFIE